MADKTIMEELCPVLTKFTDDEQMFYNNATQIEQTLHDYKPQT
jgi:low affinity Fe/Cu permease